MKTFQIRKVLWLVFVVPALLMVSACSNMQMGAQGAKTTATGSAGGANAEGENETLEKCEKALGTMAIVEDVNADWYHRLSSEFKLGSTAPILKLLAQQSNCFVVVERGRAMDNMMQERTLAQSGELRQTANFGKGQMVAADYTLSPTIIFSNSNAGGATAGFGGWAGVVGGIIGSINIKEASTMVSVIDNRSGVQLAVAEGSARNTDFGGLGALFGSSAGGALGGYTNTAEGKVIVAALTDSYNNVVRAVKNYTMQTVAGGLGTGKGGLQVQAEEAPAKAKASAKTPAKKSAPKKAAPAKTPAQK